jgi:hypothetical protein
MPDPNILAWRHTQLSIFRGIYFKTEHFLQSQIPVKKDMKTKREGFHR